jgi:excisionase family DNA binding protein
MTQTAPAHLPSLLSIDQVAQHLGVNVPHVRQLVAERRIPFIEWGRLLRFDPAEIAAWLETMHVDEAHVLGHRARGA